MKTAHASALAAQPAGDVHQARIVGGSADFSARSEDAAEFVGQHGGGDFYIFHGECTAEAAAFGGFGQVDQRKAAHLF